MMTLLAIILIIGLIVGFLFCVIALFLILGGEL